MCISLAALPVVRQFLYVSKCSQIVVNQRMDFHSSQAHDFGRPHSTYKVTHAHSDVK